MLRTIKSIKLAEKKMFAMHSHLFIALIDADEGYVKGVKQERYTNQNDT